MASATSTGGIKIAYPGYNVNTAADWQLIFNSAWPSIQIGYETTVSVPYTASNSTLAIPHNLGFYPLVQAWLSVNGVQIYSFYTTAINLTGTQSYAATGLAVDTVNVYPQWEWQLSSVTGLDPFGNKVDGSLTAELHIKCYNLDISQDANYTDPQPAPAKLPYNSNYGMKIVKATRNISSPDLRDFILHTRAQTPAVLNVSTQDMGTADPNISGNTLIQYTNPQGFAAWFFAFQLVNFGSSTTPAYRYVSVPVQPSGSGASATAGIFEQSTFQVSVPSSPGGSLVVLRDPLFTPNTTFVSY